ncbi:MAG: SpoIIE family protein phosphatase [Magnetococcales bacterium]|nr:SpoIIE family protein phosphatase [Magnetococcales bacterium]
MSTSEQRQWTRNPHRVKAVIKLAGGACIEGVTRDVSLAGAFIVAAAVPVTLTTGEKGTIELVSENHGTMELPCKLVRIAEDGVGIRLHDQDAAMGIALNCDLLDLLINIASAVSTSLELEGTLQNSVAHIRAFLHAEAASLFLLDETTETQLICRACVGPVNILGLKVGIHDGIVGRAVREMKPQIVENVSFDQDFTEIVDQKTGFITRSILCVPLQIQGRSIGAMEVLNKQDGTLFNAKDQYVLTALAATASLAILKARHAQTMVEQDRRRNELILARTIQESFLPPTRIPSFPIHGFNIPALEISGDFFDVVDLEQSGHVFFVLGDVSGKGARAGLLMAKTNSLLRYLAKSGTSPGRILQIVNGELADAVRVGMFVTVVAGLYDRQNATVRFANAGHLPVLIFNHRTQSFKEIAGQGLPLGILKEQAFDEEVVSLHENTLYCYSDGVTEATTPDGGMLGIEGLRTLLVDHHTTPANTRLAAVVAHIRGGGPLHDDLTMLLVERGPYSENGF